MFNLPCKINKFSVFLKGELIRPFFYPTFQIMSNVNPCNLPEQAFAISNNAISSSQKTTLKPAVKKATFFHFNKHSQSGISATGVKNLSGIRIFLILMALFLIIAGCQTSKTASTKAEKKSILYPGLPDTARIQYLTKISGSLDLNPKKSFFKSFIVGKQPERTFTKPNGIAIHNGKIYITDVYGGGMAIINLENRTIDAFQPTGLGQLIAPSSCAVDEKGYLYVVDHKRADVVIFDEQLNYFNHIITEQNSKPSDICIQGNKIFISYIKENKISVFSKDTVGKLLYSFPKEISAEYEKLFSPTNIAVYDDKIVVSDFFGFQLKLYSTEGKFIDTIGTHGVNIGQFAKPKGVAISRESIIYAADADFDNVQLFNEKGQFLMFFGGHYQGPGDMYTPAKVIVDYDNLKYFQEYVDPAYELKHLIFVTNNYGPDKITIYGRVEPKKTAVK